MLNKDVYKKRQEILAAVDRMNYEDKFIDFFEERINQMPLELRRVVDVDEESKKTIHSLMGIGNAKFCKVLENYKYMKKH